LRDYSPLLVVPDTIQKTGDREQKEIRSRVLTGFTGSTGFFPWTLDRTGLVHGFSTWNFGTGNPFSHFIL